MAKPRSIPGLSEDDPYAAVAVRVVATRTAELAESAAGVLDTSDIEAVHDMRVATRRLRAALEVFEPCFARKRFKIALREVKSLADALGERRDRDVTIEALSEFAAGVEPEDEPGVEGLLTRIRAEQTDANTDLAPHVSEHRVGALVELLDGLVVEAASLVGGLELDAPREPDRSVGSTLDASSNGGAAA